MTPSGPAEDNHDQGDESQIGVDTGRRGQRLVYVGWFASHADSGVTSVDQRILSNTYNRIISHLNSSIEIRQLAHYYSFGDFSDSISAPRIRATSG